LENKLSPDGQNLLSRLVSNTLLYVVAGSVVVSFVVLVFINFYSNMDDVEASYYSIASCSIIFVSIFNVSFQLLQAQKKMAGAMFVLTLLPQLLLLLFVALLTKENLYYSIIIAMFTTCCVSLYMVRNCITVLSIPTFYEIRKLIILASPLLIGVLAQVMMNWSPSLLSSFYLEPSDVGILSVCVKAAALLGFIFIAINGYASSRFSASFKSKNPIF
jgi:O-antigen/teichoic acid export membrane protein